MSITDVQLSQLYIAAAGTAVTTPAEIATAIAGGDQVANIQDLGGDPSETISVTEYPVIDSNNTTKSQGTSSFGNISPILHFDAVDTAGQTAMRTLFANRTRAVFIIQTTDEGTATPTYVTFDGFVSMRGIGIPQGGILLQKFTIELTSAYNVVDKTDT